MSLGKNGCWNWEGSLTNDGYGICSYKGKNKVAHRLIYELINGKVPDGLQLDHLCRNRKCVNPDHLEIVTCKENVRRGRVAKLTLEQVESIRDLFSIDGVLRKELSYMFNTSYSNIVRIINKETWV